MQKSFPVIETKKLILREVTGADAVDLYAYLSDPDVMKYVGMAPYETVEAVIEEIDWYQSIYEKGIGIRWGITLKNSGEVIGSCGFLNMQERHYRAEIGFELSRAYWRRGIISEALAAAIRYGFAHFELERIEALIEPENIASQKTVEKLGFLREGLLRHYEYTCGKFDDLYMYSILKGDFDESEM